MQLAQPFFELANFVMQEFGLNGSTLVAVGRTVALLRDTVTLDNCVHALEIVSSQIRNMTILLPHGGIGELILDGCARAAARTVAFVSDLFLPTAQLHFSHSFPPRSVFAAA